MTLEEKLEKFKSGTVELHTPSQGLWDKLMRELERRGYKWCNSDAPTSSTYNRWDHFKVNTCVSNCASGLYYCDFEFYRLGGCSILEITEEDFTTPSETVESVMKSIEEVKVDLEFYHELFKKYNVVMTGNLEPTMRAKLESLLKKRVAS